MATTNSWIPLRTGAAIFIRLTSQVLRRRRGAILNEGHERQFEYQVRLLYRDRQYRWVSPVGTVIRHAGGKPLRIVALDTDITRVKRIESVPQHILEGTAGMGAGAFFRVGAPLRRRTRRAMRVHYGMYWMAAKERPDARVLAS
ncbi:hypothetical protein [Paraburkholderia terrae]|uniref:hypothetical protein n=1 Tax=Paraburkholderia terrae TaxID=311230 RepID=UPI0020BE33BA|nr:hypothetical protein [Paraburkholderia terrae]